jgi:putative ABC transport system permease protein
LLFYRQYFWLVLIANALALPLTWYYMSKWLQDFAYRIDITLWMFVVSLSAGLVIAFATIAFKTIQAATVNPIQSLRSE